MRVVLDAAVGASTAQDKRHLMLGLLTHPLIELYRYADGGPPRDASQQVDSFFGPIVPGWIALEPSPDALCDYLVMYATSDVSSQCGVFAHQFMELAAADITATNYGYGAPAAARRSADVLAARVADAVQADLLITERPYLLEERPYGPTRGITVLHPDEVLPLLGLYLRRQGVFLKLRSIDGKVTSTLQRGLFYWVATHALLPNAWRWATACTRHSSVSGDTTLAHLAQSLLQRVDQALRARDDAFAALNSPQNDDTVEDALAALDGLLLFLMAAVDVTARVAHIVLNLPHDELYRASWKHGGKWERQLRRHHPELARLTNVAVHGDDLTILRLLRNTVHGPALMGMTVSDDRLRASVETLVALPVADAQTLLACVDRRGGREEWGVRQVVPGRFYADIDVLIEQLLPAVLRFLNAAMRATPVETLPPADLTQLDDAPQVENDFDSLSALSRELIGWQLGLA